MDNGSVLTVKDHGKINIKLRQIMDERQITRNFLARSINTRFEVVDKWYKNQLEVMDLDVLARICYVLDCKAEDIIEYEK